MSAITEDVRTPAARTGGTPDLQSGAVGWMQTYGGPLRWAAVIAALGLVWYLFSNQLALVQTWLALLPAAFIVHQAMFLRMSRRHQFVAALAPNGEGDCFRNASELADGFFGARALAIRYLIPAVLASVLCWFALDVLTVTVTRGSAPSANLSGAGPAPAKTPSPSDQAQPAPQRGAETMAASTAQAPASPPAADSTPTPLASGTGLPPPPPAQNTASSDGPPNAASGSDAKPPAASATPGRAPSPQGQQKAAEPATRQVPGAGAFAWLLGQGPEQSALVRGARFGFAGAYLYSLILLAQRGFRRDLTSGVAMWAAALFVLGPLSGALAALLVSGAVGGASAGTFMSDVVYVFAGMLPREFAQYMQNSARRVLQGSASALTLRTMPIAMLRGATPSIEERFAEEGIEDVGALAYASPFQLIRATSYDARQIVQWIDESLLISTVPDGWQELEKAGITGAIDLAWCHTHPASNSKLSAATKIEPELLAAIAERLHEDAQVEDLRCFYWTRSKHDDPVIPGAPNDTTQPPGGKAAAPADAPPPIEVSFETVQGTSADVQDEIVTQVAPGAQVSKNGSVVTLSKVPASDQEKVRAALGADQRVVRDSFKVAS